MATRWRHLHQLQSWPPGCVTRVATLTWNALLALSVSIEFVYSSARVTSVKFAKPPSLSLRDSNPQIGPQGHLGPINITKMHLFHISFRTFCTLHCRLRVRPSGQFSVNFQQDLSSEPQMCTSQIFPGIHAHYKMKITWKYLNTYI